MIWTLFTFLACEFHYKYVFWWDLWNSPGITFSNGISRLVLGFIVIILQANNQHSWWDWKAEKWLILNMLFCLIDGSFRSPGCTPNITCRKEKKNQISNSAGSSPYQGTYTVSLLLKSQNNSRLGNYFLWQNSIYGIAPNVLDPCLITTLNINLEHTWESAKTMRLNVGHGEE